MVNVDRVLKSARTRIATTTAAVAIAAIGASFVGSTVASANTNVAPKQNQPAAVAPAAPGAAQAPAAPAAAPAPAAAAAPSDQQLHPVGVTAAQQTFTPDAQQIANAKAIVEAGKAMNLPPRAWTIAVATSLQECNLHNIGDLGAANDHDSLGLFQQRPSSGWGTPEQIQNPTYAATAFYKGLVDVPGWDSMPLTDAAQKVQVSAYPDHYAKHEAEAGAIITSLYGSGPFAGIAAQVK